MRLTRDNRKLGISKVLLARPYISLHRDRTNNKRSESCETPTKNNEKRSKNIIDRHSWIISFRARYRETSSDFVSSDVDGEVKRIKDQFGVQGVDQETFSGCCCPFTSCEICVRISNLLHTPNQCQYNIMEDTSISSLPALYHNGEPLF